MDTKNKFQESSLSILNLPCSSAVKKLFYQYLFRCGHTRTELYRVAEALQDHLDAGDSGYNIECVSIAQMRDAEYLPLELVLTAGTGDAVILPEIFIDRLSVHSWGSFNRR